MGEGNFAEQINAANAPFAKLIGARLTLATKERLEAEIEVKKEHCTIPDNMHGGAIMAIADNMGGIGAFMNLSPGSITSTIESKTNFVRAIPIGQKVKAVTTPVNIGRTLQLWKTEFFREDGKLAAVVQQTQIVRSGEGQNVQG
ncbi:MAG: PaaI family thioesterase [Marinicaulis sp.]|nr:PaaI family thioesterase [Marinicaulis sp.]